MTNWIEKPFTYKRNSDIIFYSPMLFNVASNNRTYQPNLIKGLVMKIICVVIILLLHWYFLKWKNNSFYLSIDFAVEPKIHLLCIFNWRGKAVCTYLKEILFFKSVKGADWVADEIIQFLLSWLFSKFA